MKIADFNRLKKMMELTFSENDPEALASIRAANRILTAENLTWDRVLSKTVNVIAEFEEDPEGPTTLPRDKATKMNNDDALISEAEQKAPRSQFVESIREQFDEKGFITPKQRDAIRRIVEGEGGRR